MQLPTTLILLLARYGLADSASTFERHRRQNFPPYSNTSITSLTSIDSAPPVPATIPKSPDVTQSLSDPVMSPPVALSDLTQPTGCIASTATYISSIPPTVYITVTDTFEVTMPGNASMTASETLITPLSACHTTVLSGASLNILSVGVKTGTASNPVANGPLESATVKPKPPETPDAKSNPGASTAPPPEVPPGPSTISPSKSAGVAPQIIASSAAGGRSTVSDQSTASNNAITSTVVVTKKTPVAVTAPSNATPPVDFGGGSGQSLTGGSFQSTSPNYQVSTKGRIDSTDSGSQLSADSTLTNTKLGNTIDSTVNPSPVATSSGGRVELTAATVGNVPVSIGPSSVAIGGQVVAIPSATAATFQVDGQTFIVNPSQVIGLSTTLAILPSQQNEVATTSTLAPSVVTANGVVVTIGPSQAVISGTTYVIGINAAPTSVVVGGRTVSLGTDGVVFPSTTFAPALTIVAPLTAVTEGSLTFSIFSKDAVLSGTTYAVGSGASQKTEVIDGTTIIFGTKGVELPSTTIQPATASTGTLVTHTTSSVIGNASQTSNVPNSAIKNPFYSMFSNVASMIPLGWSLIMTWI